MVLLHQCVLHIQCITCAKHLAFYIWGPQTYFSGKKTHIFAELTHFRRMCISRAALHAFNKKKMALDTRLYIFSIGLVYSLFIVLM